MKKLYPTTIIPEPLYVHRGADRQLESCIRGMGRPGYVLVSRQMGKTNLLLNAKRALSGEDRIFVYVDLSTGYISSSDCFRDIIDTAIRTNEDKFSLVKKKIRANRGKEGLSPHKEHEIELLRLLKTYDGSIVVILDEIDSLTNTDFSDQVFAQIRSIYFARSNYPEFNRLTYVLSGVVEPTQIIKDKSKSPFNIGEKIYLDDFTYGEFCDFTEKLNVEFTEEVKIHIYSWLSGHPRMSWDVCSELEDIYIDQDFINVADVDSAIRKLYLDKFDLPPVDHIRDLVRGNIELRMAVKKISLKPTVLDGDIEKKLYLAGIVRNEINDEPSVIKNKVLSECLSKSWLDSIERSSANMLFHASEHSDAGNYIDAIDIYEKYIDSLSPNQEQRATFAFSCLGECYNKIKEHDKAIDCFMKCSYNKEFEPKEYYKNIYDLAVSYNYKGQDSECEKLFKEIIDGHKSNIVLCWSLFNYSSYVFSHDRVNNYKEAIEYIDKAISVSLEVDSVKSTSEDTSSFRSVCLLNKANIYLSISDVELGKSVLYEAFESADSTAIPYILSCIFPLESDPEILKDLSRKCISSIVNNNLQFNEPTIRLIRSEDDLLAFNIRILFKLLTFCFDSDKESFENLVDYSLPSLLPDYDDRNYLYCDLIRNFYLNSRHDLSLKLTSQVLENIDDVDFEIKLAAYKYSGLSNYISGTPYHENLRAYVSLFNENIKDVSLIRNDDFVAFAYLSVYLREARKYKEAIDVLDAMNAFYHQYDNKSDFILTYFLKSQISDALKEKENAYDYACSTVELINNREKGKSTVVDDKTVDDILRACNQIKIENIIRKPIANSSEKIGRNDPCPCGSGKKFKKCCLNKSI